MLKVVAVIVPTEEQRKRINDARENDMVANVVARWHYQDRLRHKFERTIFNDQLALGLCMLIFNPTGRRYIPKSKRYVQ